MPKLRLALLASLTALACGPAAAATAAVQLAQVGTFAAPIAIAAPAQDTTRVYVVERAGTVRVVRDGQSSLFLDISSKVVTDGERGLLSIAFAPDFATTGTFYAYLVSKAPTAPRTGDIVIARLHATSPDQADAGSLTPILTIPHDQQSNHNGGQLQFGPDGFLYAGTGDGGSGGDPSANAQSTAYSGPAVQSGVNHDPLLGKLLRMDVAGAGAAGAVPGNPYPDTGHHENLIYAIGLRNPFRFSFDRGTGDLAIGDVGQNAYEEIDHVPAGTAPGANFGWRSFEGGHTYPGAALATSQPYAPAIEKTHADGWYSITGGYVVRDPALGELAGRYVYSDYAKGQLWSARLAGGRATEDARIAGLDVSSPVAFGEDACARVYVVSLAGPVYRLSSSGRCELPPPAPPVVPGAPPGPAPAPAPAPPPAVDTRAPRLRFGRVAAQRVLSARRARVPVECDEQCTVSVRAKVRAAGSASVSLTAARRTLAPNTRVTLVLGLGPKGRRAVRRALRAHHRVLIEVRAVAVDPAGNRSARSLRIRVRR